ncbi:MAG: TIGR02646 family protein [Bacteroidales bacterium]|nr:TIGR02646 family protein [Bacteroidales bacterium]
MRKLDKGEPAQQFVDFIHRHHPVNWEEAKDESHGWREHILNHEQHGLSGYTEAPLHLEKSHIDHFRKQSLYPHFVFEWNNYVVDGKDDTYGARYKDNAIRNRADNEKLINPVIEDAQCFFKYELSGKMVPADGLNEEETERASFTITTFNLNEGSLVDRRKKIINMDIKSFEGLSDEDVLAVLLPEGFASVVEQLLKERTKKEEESS